MNFRRFFLPSILLFFFIAYSTLGIIKHLHYLSGYDLAVVDQIVWEYSRFMAPITTINSYTFTSLLTDHVELIYLFISPLYWIFNSALTLIVLQVSAIVLSAIPIYLICKKYTLKESICNAVVFSYLSFYGFQFSIWADVHSLVFGVTFLSWFVYFLLSDRKKLSFIFFILALSCKEDIALLALGLSCTDFILRRKTQSLIFILLSFIYLFAIFEIYFPHFTPGYHYSNPNGLASDITPLLLIDSQEKREVIFYSLGWFGFLSFLNPLYLLPPLLDLYHYFVLGNTNAVASHGIFLHYRSSLSSAYTPYDSRYLSIQKV